MKFLVIDTETTGFPERPSFRRGMYPYQMVDKYIPSRIVSIAWLVLGADFEVLEEKYYVIKPDSFEIPKESSQIHGITTEYANDNGISLSDMLTHLRHTLDDHWEIEYLVAHNIEFDYNILMSEIYRHDVESTLLKKITKFNQICTMKSTCHMFPDKKYPKLAQLYEMCFGVPLPNAHNASYDTKHCAECFHYLLHNNIVKI